MADLTPSTRRNRGKGPDSAARSSALERLRAHRSSSARRSESQIKLDAPIYDTVPESDYAALVARRRDDARGFIVDDDGLGYADDGEDDWSDASADPSEETPEPKKKVSRNEAPKKAPPPPISAAAAQRISSMFSKSAFKKNDEKRVAGVGSIVDDVIAEFAPDESDRRRRRRGRGAPAAPAPPPLRVPPQRFPVDVEGGFVENAENGDSGPVEAEPEAMDADVKVEEAAEDVVLEVEKCDEQEEVKVKVDEGKSETVFSLNAKISKEEGDPALSATAGWKEVREKDGSMEGDAAELNGAGDEKSEFGLDSDGKLPFYMIDAYEELFGANMGTLYLFGKVKVGSAYQSCCVIVRNMQRCLYAFPRGSGFKSNSMVEMEKELKDSHISAIEFRTTLQERASDLKNEVREKLVALNISSLSMVPVKRHYAFERTDICIGTHYVLKINYPFKDPPVPADLKGEHFFALLGTHSRFYILIDQSAQRKQEV